jgi:hypothetical protein
MPHTWRHDAEILIHARMFDAEMVRRLTLSLQIGETVWDPAEGLYMAPVSHANLYLLGGTPAHPAELKE